VSEPERDWPPGTERVGDRWVMSRTTHISAVSGVPAPRARAKITQARAAPGLKV